MIKNPHRWIVAFIWGLFWLPFEIISNIRIYGWYGFCTPEHDRGKPWQHWSRRAVLQGAKALFLALTRDWNENQQFIKWRWNPFHYVKHTSQWNETYCHVIYFNLFYPSRTGYGVVGGFHFILAGRLEGWKYNIKSTWIEKVKGFVAKKATMSS
jgi:hypothetical protein